MLNKIVNLCGAILLGLAAAFSVPAHATNTAMLDLLELLRNKGNITAQEYELLRNAALATGKKPMRQRPWSQSRPKTCPGSTPKANWRSNRRTASTNFASAGVCSMI